MSPIISTLDFEREQQLLKLFREPVRLHLLFRTTQQNSVSIFDRFDDDGEFVIIVYLLSGEVRGGCLSKPIESYTAFLFDLTTTTATKITPQHTSYNAVTLSSSNIAFGKAFEVSKAYATVKLSSCEVFNTGWPSTRGCISGNIKAAELFRVQGIGDALPHPWSEVSWTERTREVLRKAVVYHRGFTKSLKSARVLLLGPAGAGKSSFVNSVRSVVYQRISHLPIIGVASGGFTKRLKSYNIPLTRGGQPTSLTLCDVPPLGVSDTLHIINGHVIDGYKFRHKSPISTTDPYYRVKPQMTDRIHCVAFCLSATEVMGLSKESQTAYRQLHEDLSDQNTPHVILLTHVDQVCHAVSEDIRYICCSRTVQMRMQQAADLVGLPLSYVFPVKNYISEHAISLNTDILLLSALRFIQEALDDCLDTWKTEDVSPHP